MGCAITQDQSTKCPACPAAPGCLCFFLTVADGDALANFTCLESRWWEGTWYLLQNHPQSQSALPWNPLRFKENTYILESIPTTANILFFEDLVICTHVRWERLGFFEMLKILFLNSKTCTAHNSYLPLNNLHVCWGTKCSNVVAFTPVGCLKKSEWPQKSAIKMIKINAKTRLVYPVLSCNKNHTLLDSTILGG